MGDITYCCMCLVTDVRMFEMSPTVQKTYNDLITEENLSMKQMYACYECAYLLHKYAEFKTKCCNAHSILMNFLARSSEVTVENVKSINRKKNKLETKLSKACVTIIDYLPDEQNACHTVDKQNNIVKAKDDVYLRVEIQPINNEVTNIDNHLSTGDHQEFNRVKKTGSCDGNTQQHEILGNFQRGNLLEVNCPAYEPKNDWVTEDNVGGIKSELDLENSTGTDIPTDALSDGKLGLGSDSYTESNEKIGFSSYNDGLNALCDDKLEFHENNHNDELIGTSTTYPYSKTKKRKHACLKTNIVKRKVTTKRVTKISVDKEQRDINKEYATVDSLNPDDAKDHFLRKKTSNYIECTLCRQGFKTEASYQTHMNKHSPMQADVMKTPENQNDYNINDYFQNNHHQHTSAPQCDITCQSTSISSSSFSPSLGHSMESSTSGFCSVNLEFEEQVSDEKCENINIGESTTDYSRNQEDILLSGEEVDLNKKGKKRKRNVESWKCNKIKFLRNSGKQYTNNRHRIVESRSVKSPCDSKCRLKCNENITADQRQVIFDAYWKLGQLNAQRTYIKSCISDIIPRYKYTNSSKPRKWNKAFHFIVQGKSIRVCKTFFTRTLDISDRVIRTVRTKTDENGILAKDRRGMHNNHSKVNKVLQADIRQFIEAIPRIEPHYETHSSTREYIDGGKTISELYKDFSETQNKNNRTAGKYCTFYKVFTECNISFFRPQKDRCTLCEQYKSSTPGQRVSLQESYDAHLEEELLSQKEKHQDCCSIDNQNKVLLLDLHSGLWSPRGSASQLYYKSKLNSYNFTVTFLNKGVAGRMKDAYDDVNCFFWNETDGKCGVNEMGSCLLETFEKLSAESFGDSGYNLVLYSDKCCGQIKNKYIAALYLYAVTHLNIESITHKFFIKGHTQNDDNIESLIERKITKHLKSKPIYSPHQYVSIIKKAKKCGMEMVMNELAFDSFIDLKKLQEDWGPNFNNTVDNMPVLWKHIKVLKVCKSKPFSFFLKTSYKDKEYMEVCVTDKDEKIMQLFEISPTNAYTEKQQLSERKKKDLRELLSENLIPSFYSDFFQSIL